MPPVRLPQEARIPLADGLDQNSTRAEQCPQQCPWKCRLAAPRTTESATMRKGYGRFPAIEASSRISSRSGPDGVNGAGFAAETDLLRRALACFPAHLARPSVRNPGDASRAGSRRGAAGSRHSLPAGITAPTEGRPHPGSGRYRDPEIGARPELESFIRSHLRANCVRVTYFAPILPWVVFLMDSARCVG